MYAKFFFERFWEGDQKNELFVCMPFHDSFDDKFHKAVDVAAKKAGFDGEVRVKEDKKPNVIKDKIFALVLILIFISSKIGDVRSERS